MNASLDDRQWPGKWSLVRLPGSKVPCTMLVGQCACGEIHVPDEFKYVYERKKHYGRIHRFGKPVPTYCVFSRREALELGLIKRQRKAKTVSVKAAPPKIIVSFTPEIKAKLDFISETDGRNVTDLHREAIAQFIAEWERSRGVSAPSQYESQRPRQAAGRIRAKQLERQKNAKRKEQRSSR